MKALVIWFTKRRLRRAYLAYCEMLDGSRAGLHVTSQLPSVAAQRQRCNALIARLRRLDPACPIRELA